MLIYVWQAGHTGRQFGSGPKGIVVPAEPLKKLDVSWPGIRGGGRDWNPTSRILDRWAANAGRSEGAPSGKGYAVETRAIWGCLMKSAIVKRSIVVAGHKTSVSLEDAFWNGHDLVGAGRRNRCSAATRQSVIGRSAFRARLLSRPTFSRKGRARRNSRDDRLRCACFSLSLYGQPTGSRLPIRGSRLPPCPGEAARVRLATRRRGGRVAGRGAASRQVASAFSGRPLPSAARLSRVYVSHIAGLAAALPI
jgi:hypothetical protein